MHNQSQSTLWPTFLDFEEFLFPLACYIAEIDIVRPCLCDMKRHNHCVDYIRMRIKKMNHHDGVNMCFATFMTFQFFLDKWPCCDVSIFYTSLCLIAFLWRSFYRTSLQLTLFLFRFFNIYNFSSLVNLLLLSTVPNFISPPTVVPHYAGFCFLDDVFCAHFFFFSFLASDCA